ncbi:MAG: hypothetical protein UV61_C0013G0012 [Candidatus Gottesmanbacteria bacterium GW2011_GWB1_43_11]|uniref:Uncharacterized protein n=1 Tax=Candidatus Gottesmanbacteria bacterium GW2011_GWB1_43_11 TaxID=1618446 RepID=A0A0G1CKR0_9BACT|nr:MAG: hypothetical protein UV17_C0029G0012 [Candidatus Gottesmanbacteria bacterium GW2011_GWA1_42_26]KKS86077.1 MAG: hypothetical protein UV61_C0013G0012 [Candidatus Gottesmanbacteria bacterium GW2011_GWB1_43_11]OGG09819.1 MAG: hypothetical protein A2699_02705 [Candidatus Gottesmanbacteria bacterium RIFCSPHIGHO2_01_FULL_43_15]OGG23548.1 MAG: hypothetical protein A3A59_02285 [Candidatus Gottesmanbacteria bacterium RIFCSPLOWO2_01_FULL_42_10]HCM37150.1 hypothetical protein [Patescibacteria group
MAYYRDSVTQKSWLFLQELRRKFHFVLIGGWAIWLYTRQLKSKDIDIVVELSELDKLKTTYDLTKNERLKKYEIKQGEVDVDIYVPFYSTPGVAAEQILKNVVEIESFKIPSRELLLVLKTVAWKSRRMSAKGRKDLIDIVSLLATGKLAAGKLNDLFTEGPLRMAKEALIEELKTATDIGELSLNQHQVARAKKDWFKILNPET